MELSATVAAVKDAVSGLGGAFMTSKRTFAVGEELGVPGWDFYVTGRGGVLGAVDADVVAAAFVYFPRAWVREHWERATAVVPPSEGAPLRRRVRVVGGLPPRRLRRGGAPGRAGRARRRRRGRGGVAAVRRLAGAAPPRRSGRARRPSAQRLARAPRRLSRRRGARRRPHPARGDRVGSLRPGQRHLLRLARTVSRPRATGRRSRGRRGDHRPARRPRLRHPLGRRAGRGWSSCSPRPAPPRSRPADPARISGRPRLGGRHRSPCRRAHTRVGSPHSFTNPSAWVWSKRSAAS